MKTQGNYPIPDKLLWKDGQWMYLVNAIDDGITDDGQKKYIADFTITDGEGINDVMYAFTRMTEEPVRDQKIIQNTVTTEQGLNLKPVYTNLVSTTIFKPLPATGSLKKGRIYSYGNGAVMVVQDHERTIYAPELTPALFSFYRTITEGKEWIVGEDISLNATRTYNSKTWKCIQAHQSQLTWNPELTTGTLWSIVVTNDYTNAPQWVTGNWGQYVIGFAVKDSGKIWKVKGTTHTWIQPSLTGNGAISWNFIQNI